MVANQWLNGKTIAAENWERDKNLMLKMADRV
jgi:hypothetical protein